MLTESLNIYVIDKDGNKVTFPNVEGMQPAIVDVNLNRERMAGAPTNTSTLMYPICLDSYWTKKEFIEIGSERYYVKQVPTSEKNIEDARYKHEITFVSERDILENVFFFDCVTQDSASQISDKPRTNTTDFSFYGDLNELVQRLNDSLSYSKIYDPKGENGFCIVIDDDVEIGEAKEVSMTDAYFATAMQEIYNVFEVPYYWVGKVCHVGYQENEITEPFEYGSGNGLISVQKTNAEFRLINRITGQGSADNIPYYYPNTDPNGIPVTDYKNMQESDISGVVPTKIANLVGGIIGKRIYFGEIQKDNGTVLINEQKQYAQKETWQISKDDQDFGNDVVERDYSPGFEKYEISFYANVGDKIDLTKAQFKYNVTIVSDYNVTCNPTPNKDSVLYWGNGVDADIFVIDPDNTDWRITSNDLTYKCAKNGLHKLTIHCNPIYDYINCHVDFPENKDVVPVEATFAFTLTGSIFLTTTEGNVVVCDNVIYPEKKIPFNVSNWGALRLLNISPAFDANKGIVVDEILQGYDYSSCSQFCILDIKKTNIMSKLMPSVYRQTEGAERFYNAENETYLDENENYYSFNNPYVPSEPLEGKQDFEDIKPTINGITNENGELFGEIAAVAFDDTDSDDLSIEDASDANANTAKPVHPYFYVKLHKFSGENGFNLFKQGLAQGAMTFNFITGSCAGCSFKVQVSEGKQVDNHYEFQNHVQVDEQGNIVAGDSGDKIKASNPIASQQDTMTNSVWIALEKDNSTFGVLMPNATNNYRPQAEDKFVITNILLPTQYITAAEKRLDAALVKYMSENNDEKFTFSIKFSRIYLQEHPEIAEKINENTKLHVKYNNVDYPLYVSSYSRKSDDNILDEISVELSEKLTIAQNKSKEQMDSIMGNVNEQINSAIQNNNNNTSQGVSANDINSLKALLGNKLSRISDDTAAGIITFLQGTNWGNFTSETGAAMTVDPTTGQTYMEVDRLKVRLKAFFEQLEVQKVGYVGGKLIVTKGQGVDILDVENIYDTEGNVSAYRCYFLGEQEGRKIDNLLRIKDQMICKDFNVSEGSTDGATNKYYWRLATAVSSDVVKRGNNVCHWVDLSATDCDTGSDIPEIGDTICHLGNREDTDRQGAEILSVVDANSPSFTIYSGINSYSLVNKEYIDMGVAGGKAYCNIYGSTYIGDRERKGGYLRWNDDKKTFEIKGTIDITSPLSSGGTIGGAIDNAANAYKGEFDAFTSNVNEVIGGFQAQIDGVIETWFYEPEPTLGNEPAVNWTDNATKDKHLGDLYYSGEGIAYRFQKEGDNYVWKQIDDTAITKALAEAKAANDAANAAQGTADSKMRVSVVQPTADDEYSVGDMWVNATYGTTYKNDILKCKTPKKKGEAFSIDHWEKASKYTDDTAAQEAQKKANEAATAAQEINASITAIDGNVDVALKDKIITKTEAAAIKEALNGLDAIMADVNKTKEELVNNAVYKNIAADVKTDYDTTYTNLKAAYNELSKYINDTLLVAKTITDEILSSYTTKYSTFKTKYEDYVSKLTVVRNSMDALLNTRIGDIATMLGGLKATTDAMNESTQINGGLILSSLLALGYTKNTVFNVMSGVSGLYESGETGGGIAFWAGGHRIDINNCTKNSDGTYSIGGKVVNPADFLVRHDGTGYAAGGKMWWDEDGKIHADPQSFLINEQYVGNVMQLFQFEYSGGTDFTHIVHAIPQKPFESLSVGANGLTLYNGGKSAKFYIKDGVLFLDGDLAVTGGITMYASNGVASGMIDQVYAVLDPAIFSKQGDYITIKGDIGGGTVKAVKVGSTQYDPDSNGIISLPDYPTVTTLEWDNILNKPSTFTPASHTHTFASLTSKPTTLSGYGITDAKIANGVITLGTATITPLTAHQKVTLASGTNNGTLKLTVGSKTTDNIAVKGLGSAAYTASSAYAAAGHTHSYLPLAGGTMTGGITFSNTSHLQWNSGSYHQRIFLTDDSTADTAVFTFQQSTDSGTKWSNLMVIRDNGKVIANTFVGALSGNASTASKWKTARKITLTGSVTGSVSIDGSGNVTLATTTNHTHSYLPLSGGTMEGAIQMGSFDLRFQGSDSGDLTWCDENGNVTERIWSSNGRGSLYFRANEGPTCTLYHSGNLTSLPANGGNADTVDGEHSSAFAHIGTSNNLLVNGNEFNFASSGFSGSIYFNYRTAGGTNGNITEYIFGNGKGGALGIALHTGNYTSYCAPASHSHSYLPLSGGTLTGNLTISQGNVMLINEIEATDTYGLMAYKPSSWTGVSSSQFGVGSISTETVIRSNNTSLLHYREGSGTYTILDSANYGSYALPLSGGKLTGHLWLNAQVADSSSGGRSQLVFGNNGTQHVVITSNTGAIVINPNTGDTTGQLVLRVGASETSNFAGNITAGGGITMYSDLRKKNVISDEVLSVKEIAAAPLFRHTYKSDDNQYIHVGTSAQYWSGIHEDWFTRKDSEGYYQMELQNLGVAMGISLAREIVKYESKTDKKIRLMKKKINDLEARIKELEGSREERRTA